MASRLAEIYRSEKSTGGGLGSAIGKNLKEKIDPRKMFDQRGLLVSMFPSLKTYNATGKNNISQKISGDSGSGIDNDILNSIAATSSLTAKNSMSLPMMARDMNLMKLNMFKLVKLQGGTANTNKTDVFWKNAKDRETAYENTIGKFSGSKIRGMLGVKQRRDGQSPSTALFVQTGGTGASTEGMLSGLLNSNTLKSILTATVGFLTSPVALTVMGGAALFGIMKTLMDKNSDKEGVDLATKALGGSLDESQFGSEIMNAAEEGQRQREAEDLKRRTVSGPLERLPEKLPDTGAGGGRGFVNPELVSPSPSSSPVPSNVIMSGSGVPLTSGSGEYITSGTSPVSTTGTAQGTMGSYVSRGASPSPVSSTATSGGTSPKPVTSNPSEGEKAVRAAASKYGITDETEINALLAQTSHESGNYKYLTELGGKSYFDKYEPGTSKGRELGNTQPGDGYKYRGRGYIQLTGKDNYQKFAQFSGIDVVNNPDLVATPAVGAEAALWYWKTRVKPKVKDFSNVKQVTQLVNGGQNGIVDREQKFAALMASSSGQSTSSSLASIKPSVTPSSPSSGSVVASASTSVSDGKMAAMAPSSGNTVINNKPTTVASNKPSSGGKTASTYDNEIFQSLVGYQSGTA